MSKVRVQGLARTHPQEVILSGERAQPTSKTAAAAPKKARAAKTGSTAAAASKPAAPKKAAAKTGAKAAAAPKKTAAVKSAKTGKYQIFDSPLVPRHFSVDRLRRVAKKS